MVSSSNLFGVLQQELICAGQVRILEGLGLRILGLRVYDSGFRV